MSRVNLQVLSIALNVASKKLEKMPAQPVLQQAAASHLSQLTPPLQSGTGWTFMPLQVENGKMLLQYRSWTGPEVLRSSMEEHVSVTGLPVVASGAITAPAPQRNFSLTNPRNKINSIISLDIIEDDKENLFDGRVLITLAAAEHLQVKDGDRVMVEVPKGTGLFGWEGI